MKKLLLSIIFFMIFSQVNALNFIYPLDKISTPKCRFSNWSELGEDCKMSLPRITNGDYTKFKDDKNMRKIYSILWGATYNYGWDVGFGSHLGVDITTSAGTPVISIGDGEVIVAGWLAGRGNTVVIKHQLSDGKYIYSNYAHMSKITTKLGGIKVGESVGEVGSSGNAYGNHLHFQIDTTNQSHPYWYSVCSKGIDITSVVNDGMCRDYLLTNTIDPILFLESNGTFVNVTIDQIKQKQDLTKKIEQTSIKTREQILDEEIDDFLKNHSFELKTQATGDNLRTKLTYITKLFVYENGRLFGGNLPGNGAEFVYDNKNLTVNPTNIIASEKNGRDINITSQKSGAYTISFKLGKKIVYSKNINFYSSGELSSPTDAIIITNTKQTIALGDEKMGAIIMKTKFGTKQVYIPYDGTYKLKVLSGKVKFCNISKKTKKTCNPFELVSELEFRYEDTKAGILLFSFIAFDYSPVKFTLQKVGAKYDITWLKSDILVSNPLRVDSTYSYYNENIDAIKKGYLRLNNGYLLQDRDLVGNKMKEIINNYYAFEYLKSGDNTSKKNQILQKIKDCQIRLIAIGDYKSITRGELAKILFENLGINIIKNDEVKLLDEKGVYKDYITTLRENYNFKWKDSFADNYFQPDKVITIGETLYFIGKIGSLSQT